jgi:hypothetical protein
MFVALLAVFIMACVADDPVDNTIKIEQQASAKMQVDMSSTADDTPDVDPDVLWSNEGEPKNTCVQTVQDPCNANLPICAVRCCDHNDPPFRSRQTCGNCQTWANGACLSHGGPLHVRWDKAMPGE